jgi:hypothetical protein
MDKQMIGICGAYCGECEWREGTNCPGCQACQSKVFWGTCQIAKCAIEKKHTHCGTCSKLPCEKLTEAFINSEHGDNGERLMNLKGWAKGEETYLKLRMLKDTRK